MRLRSLVRPATMPRAGVLLALPAWLPAAFSSVPKTIYGSLGPAFYGLRTSLLTLLLMALWRIKRPEGLKEYSPARPGTRARVGSRAGGQNSAAQTGPIGCRRVAPPSSVRLWLSSGSLARRGPGLPLRRWPCAGLPRPTSLAQSPRGPHALVDARDLRLLGQRPGGRSAVRRHSRGQRRPGENAARHTWHRCATWWASAASRWFLIAVASAPNSSSRSWPLALICSPIARAAIPASPASASDHAGLVVNGRIEHLRLGRPRGALTQGQVAPAPGHPPDGQRPSNPHPDLAAGSARRSGGLSNVQSLATGELLQVPARGIRAGCAWPSTPRCPTIPTREVPNPAWAALDAQLRQAYA